MTESVAPEAGIPQWDVADRMRKSLRNAALGVQEMADYLDVSRNTVSTWINGRIEPSVQTLRLWAFRTGVSYAWLKDGLTSSGPTGGGAVNRGHNLRYISQSPRVASRVGDRQLALCAA